MKTKKKDKIKDKNYPGEVVMSQRLIAEAIDKAEFDKAILLIEHMKWVHHGCGKVE